MAKVSRMDGEFAEFQPEGERQVFETDLQETGSSTAAFGSKYEGKYEFRCAPLSAVIIRSDV